jgi:hypothetical protein
MNAKRKTQIKDLLLYIIIVLSSNPWGEENDGRQKPATSIPIIYGGNHLA